MNGRKKIKTDNFKIENNIISFNDTLLQISNISQISIEPVPNMKLNFWSFAIIILGIIMVQDEYNDTAFNLGLIFITLASAYIFIIILKNLCNEEKYLQIYLSSGNVYCILCNNKKFLKEIMDVLEYCINNHCIQNILIDFDNCKVENSPIIIGDENEVK